MHRDEWIKSTAVAQCFALFYMYQISFTLISTCGCRQFAHQHTLHTTHTTLPGKSPPRDLQNHCPATPRHTPAAQQPTGAIHMTLSQCCIWTAYDSTNCAQTGHEEIVRAQVDDHIFIRVCGCSPHLIVASLIQSTFPRNPFA